MRSTILLVLITATSFFLASKIALSHCDTLAGPVITDARKALETENINLVLIWVQQKDEAEIRKAFEETLTMRKMNSEAKDFADRYFFETLVRIHRAGEGASYSGLKSGEIEHVISVADKALTSEIRPVKELLLNEIQEELMKRYQEVKGKQNYDKNDVTAGREYVTAYVSFIHYVEAIHSLAVKGNNHSEQAAQHFHD
jgi:hypothetical protein